MEHMVVEERHAHDSRWWNHETMGNSGLNRICGDVLAGVAHIAHISTEWHLCLVGLPHAFHWVGVWEMPTFDGQVQFDLAHLTSAIVLIEPRLTTHHGIQHVDGWWWNIRIAPQVVPKHLRDQNSQNFMRQSGWGVGLQNHAHRKWFSLCIGQIFTQLRDDPIGQTSACCCCKPCQDGKTEHGFRRSLHRNTC